MKYKCLLTALALDFILASAQFTVEPVAVVQAEGLEAVFECLYPGATTYGWFVNGEDPIQHGGRTVTPTTSSPAKLFIPAVPRCNNSLVQCEATVEERGTSLRFELSKNATLTIQAPLSVVGNLNAKADSVCSQLTISWSAPFSLDLTTADPDIQYCVDVYNVTGGGSHHLDSVCGITDTQYTYTAPDPTGVYNFTVTPRSNIQGSLNGTTSQPAQFSYVPLPINEFKFITSTDLNPLQVIFPSAAVSPCSHLYSVEMKLVEAGSLPCVCSAADTINGDMIILNLNCERCGIERRRRYSMRVLVDGVPSQPKKISTHDVYKVDDFVIPMEGQVEIVAEYLINSTVEGFFLILHSNNHTVYRVANRTGSEPSTSVTVSGLRNNVYKLAVYDLYDNNTLGFLEPASNPGVLPDGEIYSEMMEGTEQPTTPSATDIEVKGINGGSICMMCSSPGLSGCVGVIHSAPLDTYNLTVLTARAGVEECTSERFQGELSVAVFDMGERGLGESPSYQTTVNVIPSSSQAAYIAIGVIVAAVVISLLSILSCVMYAVCKKNKTGSARVMDALPPPPDAVLTKGEHGYGIIVNDQRQLEVESSDPSVTVLPQRDTPSFIMSPNAQEDILSMSGVALDETIRSQSTLPALQLDLVSVQQPENPRPGSPLPGKPQEEPDHESASQLVSVELSENPQHGSPLPDTFHGEPEPASSTDPHTSSSVIVLVQPITGESNTKIDIETGDITQQLTTDCSKEEKSVSPPVSDEQDEPPKKDPNMGAIKSKSPVKKAVVPVQSQYNDCTMDAVMAVLNGDQLVARSWDKIRAALGLPANRFTTIKHSKRTDALKLELVMKYYFESSNPSWDKIETALKECNELRAARRINDVKWRFGVPQRPKTALITKPTSHSGKKSEDKRRLSLPAQLQSRNVGVDKQSTNGGGELSSRAVMKDAVDHNEEQSLLKYSGEVDFPSPVHESGNGNEGAMLVGAIPAPFPEEHSDGDRFIGATKTDKPQKKSLWHSNILSGQDSSIYQCEHARDKSCCDIELEKSSYYPGQCTDDSPIKYTNALIHSLGVYSKLDVLEKYKHSALGYINSESYLTNQVQLQAKAPFVFVTKRNDEVNDQARIDIEVSNNEEFTEANRTASDVQISTIDEAPIQRPEVKELVEFLSRAKSVDINVKISLLLSTFSLNCEVIEDSPCQTQSPDKEPPDRELRDVEQPHDEEFGDAEKPPKEQLGDAEKPPKEQLGDAEKPPKEQLGGAEKPPIEQLGGAEKPPQEELGGAEKPPKGELRGAEKLPDKRLGDAEITDPSPLVSVNTSTEEDKVEPSQQVPSNSKDGQIVTEKSTTAVYQLINNGTGHGDAFSLSLKRVTQRGVLLPAFSGTEHLNDASTMRLLTHTFFNKNVSKSLKLSVRELFRPPGEGSYWANDTGEPPTFPSALSPSVQTFQRNSGGKDYDAQHNCVPDTKGGSTLKYLGKLTF